MRNKQGIIQLFFFRRLQRNKQMGEQLYLSRFRNIMKCATTKCDCIFPVAKYNKLHGGEMQLYFGFCEHHNYILLRQHTTAYTWGIYNCIFF